MPIPIDLSGTLATADTQAPTAPGAPEVTAVDANSVVTITFAAATDNVAVIRYAAFIDDNANAYSFSETPQFKLKGLKAGAHKVAVQAYDAAGNASLLSAWTDFSVPFPNRILINQDAIIVNVPLTGIAGSVLVQGGLGANAYATDVWNGTKIGWNEASNAATTDKVDVGYAFSAPVDMTDYERIKFEFDAHGNMNNAELYLIIFSSDGSLNDASVFKYLNTGLATRILDENCLSLLKSDFVKYGVNAVDWSQVRGIDVRLLPTAKGPNQKAEVNLKHVSFGGREQAYVAFSCDDGDASLYSLFDKVWRQRNMAGTMFLTDFEIPGCNLFGQEQTNQCTQWQLDEMAQHGFEFAAHCAQHNPYALKVVGYARSADTLQLEINPGPTLASTGETALQRMGGIQAGDFIYIADCPAYTYNGRWPVQAITPSGSNYIIDIDVTGVTNVFSDEATQYGTTIYPENYDIDYQIKTVLQILKRSGLPVVDYALSYTYGISNGKVRELLMKSGFRLCRGMGGVYAYQEPPTMRSVMQLNRINGFGANSQRLMNLESRPMISIGDLQASVDRLIATGGVLSIHSHGYDGIESDIVDLSNWLCDLRDQGKLKIVNFSQLDKVIRSRPA